MKGIVYPGFPFPFISCKIEGSMLVSHLGHLEVVHGLEEQRKFKGTWDPKESHPKLKYSPWDGYIRNQPWLY